MAAEDDAWVYYEIDACPCASECNETNFKNWKPWGSTPEEARQKVVDHLMRSGVHAQSRGDMTDGVAKDYFIALVDGCEVHERQWKQQKKKRKAADSVDLEVQVSRQEVQRMMQTGLHRPVSPPRRRGGSSGSGSIVAAPHQRTVQEVFSDFADNAARCGRNARNAARLSEAAAGSFNEQAE
eukprot:5163462-Pyramimonas_sp.AAC.1